MGVGMLQTPCDSPSAFCYGLSCPCCFVYQQRKELLDITQEPYVCCAGLGGCGPCTRPCGSRNPWLCLEAFCCTNNAILGNRFMMQTRFNIQNDPCDARLIKLVACLNCFACCVSCCAQIFMDKDKAKNCTDCYTQAIECVNASVCSCMLAQQSIELKSLKSVDYKGIKPSVMTVLPPRQQEMLQG